MLRLLLAGDPRRLFAAVWRERDATRSEFALPICRPADACACEGKQEIYARVFFHGGYPVWRKMRQMNSRFRHAAECAAVWKILRRFCRSLLGSECDNSVRFPLSTLDSTDDDWQPPCTLAEDCQRNNPILFLRALSMGWQGSGLIFKRPLYLGTVPIRAEHGFSTGTHAWLIGWSEACGTHASIGVVSDRCTVAGQLQYCHWVGSVPHSWGVDIASLTKKHDGRDIDDDTFAGISSDFCFDTSQMVLVVDATHGDVSLYLKVLPSLEWRKLLIAQRIPERPLYPAVGSVFKNTAISLVYLGLVKRSANG